MLQKHENYKKGVKFLHVWIIWGEPVQVICVWVVGMSQLTMYVKASSLHLDHSFNVCMQLLYTAVHVNLSTQKMLVGTHYTGNMFTKFTQSTIKRTSANIHKGQ